MQALMLIHSCSSYVHMFQSSILIRISFGAWSSCGEVKRAAQPRGAGRFRPKIGGERVRLF
jgi:hypothetical protein